MALSSTNKTVFFTFDDVFYKNLEKALTKIQNVCYNIIRVKERRESHGRYNKPCNSDNQLGNRDYRVQGLQEVMQKLPCCGRGADSLVIL